MAESLEKEENQDADGVFSLSGNEDSLLEASVVEAADGEITLLKAALLAKTEEVQQVKQKQLYLLADFENYKKRAQKEQIDQAKFSNEKVIKEVLVVLDDLERASLHLKETGDVSAVQEGLDLIKKQFVSFLGRFGVVAIESLRKPFDPVCHQAIGMLDRPDEEPNLVVEEAQKGYLLYDRIIRPAMVMISKK